MKRFIERRKKPRLNKVVAGILLTIFSTILMFSAAFAYLITAPLGGKILVRYFEKEFAAIGLMHVGYYTGSLQNGFVLKDIRIKGLSYFPTALLRIQEIDVHISLKDLRHFDLDIFNARIFIPDSDPVVFTGKVLGDEINGELYGRSVDIHEAVRFWGSEDVRKYLQGFISNIDFTIQGSLSSPQVKGSFLGDSIQYNSTLLSDLFSRVDLIFSPSARRGEYCQMKGQIFFDSGLVNVRKTNLNLLPSKFVIRGDVFNPIVDIHLGAKVEDMDIHMSIKGTSIDPKMEVTSDPPMPPQDALRVLFTGNAWSSSTSPFNGVSSSQLAQNFLNYSLQDINDEQFGLKTKIIGNLKLGAEMDQMPAPPGVTNIYYSRKINGEMDLNDHMSLNVSQEVMPQDSYPPTGSQDGQPQADTQVYMQYKKRF